MTHGERIVHCLLDSEDFDPGEIISDLPGNTLGTVFAQHGFQQSEPPKSWGFKLEQWKRTALGEYLIITASIYPQKLPDGGTHVTFSFDFGRNTISIGRNIRDVDQLDRLLNRIDAKGRSGLWSWLVKGKGGLDEAAEDDDEEFDIENIISSTPQGTFTAALKQHGYLQHGYANVPAKPGEWIKPRGTALIYVYVDQYNPNNLTFKFDLSLGNFSRETFTKTYTLNPYLVTWLLDTIDSMNNAELLDWVKRQKNGFVGESEDITPEDVVYDFEQNAIQALKLHGFQFSTKRDGLTVMAKNIRLGTCWITLKGNDVHFSVSPQGGSAFYEKGYRFEDIERFKEFIDVLERVGTPTAFFRMFRS